MMRFSATLARGLIRAASGVAAVAFAALTRLPPRLKMRRRQQDLGEMKKDVQALNKVSGRAGGSK